MILKSGIMKLSTFIVSFVFMFLLPKPSFCQPSDKVDRFLDYIEKADEHYESLRRSRGARSGNCGIVHVDRNSISDIQNNQLENHRGLLFYFYEFNSLKIFLLTKTHFYFDSVQIDSEELLALEVDFRQALGIEHLARDRSPQLRGAKRVYSESSNAVDIDSITRKVSSIFFPVKIRKGIDSLRNLVIQPSGNIGLFPFAALKPFENAPEDYLIDRMSYSISPNVCFLLGVSDNYSYEYWGWNHPGFYKFENPLLIGDPIYYQKDYHFPPLPGARSEVKKIHEKIGGRMLLGSEAELSVVKKYSKESDFLYFATHGITSLTYDSTSGLATSLDKSFLTFTPDNNSCTGYWTAREIQSERFKADLAVLSACQTGNGLALDAGFIGIGRSFFLAGVKNSIVSLWNVDDATTENLMVRFIEELQKPDYFFPSEHLRQAMLHQKSLTPEPRYWAPFMVFGIGY